MTRAARLDLRSFQQELATRLAAKTAAQVESSRLGLAMRRRALADPALPDAGEVIAVPPIVPVPLTQPLVPRPREHPRQPVQRHRFRRRSSAAHRSCPATLARLILLAAARGEQNAGIVVQRVLGLRNLARAAARGRTSRAGARPGTRSAGWTPTAIAWQEIDLGKLARDPAFLQVGA